MKKTLLATSLLSILLTACGSDSTDDTEKTDTPKAPKIDASLKGPAKEPALTAAAVKEGDNVAINSLLTGTVVAGSFVQFVFTPEKSQAVVFALSSTAAKDLDLDIITDEYTEDFTAVDSTEHAYIEVKKGIPYSIKVKSRSGGGAFQLKLAEANRETFNLTDTEFFYTGVGTDSFDCISSTGVDEPKDTAKIRDQFIINWEGEYLRYGGEKRSFSSVNGNVSNHSYSHSRENPNFTLSANVVLTLNTKNSNIQYSEKYNLKNSDNVGGCTGDWEVPVTVKL